MRQRPDQFDCLYLSGLITYRRGDETGGRDLVARACRLHPEVTRFDHMIGLLRQQGRDDWLSVHRARLQKFFATRAVDSFVISYPKCGRTWLRLMLGRYLLDGKAGDPLDVKGITIGRADLPTVHFSHDDYPHWKPVHDLHADKSIYEGKTVALLVRDPRDVVVSYYFQYTRRGDRVHANDASFAGTLSDFIRHDIGGIRSVVGFYNIWARNRTAPRRFAMLRYEDFHQDAERELTSLVGFLGLPDLGEDRIAAAVRFASFENMRALERAGALPGERLAPAASDDPEAFKTRRGVAGGHVDYLTPDDLRYVDGLIESELDDSYASYKRKRQ